MEFVQALKGGNREHFHDGFIWLGYALIGGLLPVWFTILVLLLFGQGLSLDLFTEHGEFALYSASYIGGSLYVVLRDFKNQYRYPSRAILSLALIGMLLLSVAMFSQIALADMFERININEPKALLDSSIVSAISWLLLPTVLGLSLLVTVAENIRLQVDLGIRNKQNLSDLGTAFDALGDEDHG